MHYKSKWFIGLALLVLIAASLACGGGTGSVDVEPADDPGEVVVDNESGETICYVYISPETSEFWEQDQRSSATIDPGESAFFSVEPGVYDLRAETCGEDLVDEIYGIDLISDGYTWDAGVDE